MNCKIEHRVKGFQTRDGAGVSLVRVLGHDTTKAFDPILLLDSFDSKNPSDYTAGFPMHPHRGIETISYVYRGRMTHRDSLGNEDTVSDEEVQWMTAGCGILHEEMIPASERLLGVQLWLNLPAKEKMVAPAYHRIKKETIKEVLFIGGKVRVLAGTYHSVEGFLSVHLPFNYYDVHMEKDAVWEMTFSEEKSVILFSLCGEFLIEGETIEPKTAVKLSSGTSLVVKGLSKNGQLLYIESTPVNEPIAWGGPIVMNTKDELNQAFEDLRKGVFISKGIEYEE